MILQSSPMSCPATPDFALQRRNMVESQLRPNKVTDERILTLMEELPREWFVPEAARGVSYQDEDVVIATGRSLLEPMLLARMLQALRVQPTDRVLEIACGTGYGTAILAQLGGSVTAIDMDSSLLAAASANLRRLNLTARLTAAPFARGLPEEAPYDVIFIGGAVAEVPESWGAQLAEGGRMVVVVRKDSGVAQYGVAYLYEKKEGLLAVHPLFDAQTPYLPGMTPKPHFVF